MQKDTIYITVVDMDRMPVSLIYSVFHGFGSGIASEKFGVLFQNRGAGFTLQDGHARFVSNITYFGINVQTVIAAPHSFAEGSGVKIESGCTDQVRAKPSDLGHKVTIPDGPIGGGQAIIIDETGVLIGGSDPRKGGCALGY